MVVKIPNESFQRETLQYSSRVEAGQAGVAVYIANGIILRPELHREYGITDVSDATAKRTSIVLMKYSSCRL